MKHPIRWLALAVLLSAAGAQAGSRPADSILDLPIREVTVFSDRARILRSGQIRLDKGIQTLILPQLPPSADPDSVRVEAFGARVTRVEVKRATLDEFPKTEAERLLQQLNKLRDEAGALTEQLATLEEERKVLSAIRPAAILRNDEHLPPPMLDPSGWHASLQFLNSRQASIDDAEVPLEVQLKGKQEEIATVAARAQQILNGASSQEQLKVSAIVEGEGKPAQLSLIYMAQGAVWRPGYDVRYTPGENAVEVAYSGLVAQQTGEDWNDAQLTLSTAVPTTTATLPELAVWKIGQRERFIPTPEAAPQAPVTMGYAFDGDNQTGQVADESASLRSALEEAANNATGGLTGEGRGYGTGMAAPQRRTRVRTYRKSAKTAAPRYEEQEQMRAEAPPPPAPVPMEAPSAMPMAAAPSAAYDTEAVSSGGARGAASEAISFGAPRGWQQPALAGDLPASLAGGYTFTYQSARKESIRNGGEVRRVPLYARRLPANPFLKILPALSKQAFLVAEITNDGDKPLLAGQAHLFVGADLVGDATVPTTAVGQKVTLALGVDDSIRIERNVTTVESQKGVFSKQDVNAYDVVIELMNPRAKAVKARVFDQVPLTNQKDVEIALTKMEPDAHRDETDGALRWELELPPGARKVLSFTYSLARPKDSRMNQHSAAATGEH